jgi:GDP-mannose 6-dehydrogenase
MRISVFGLGYVGAVTAACLADEGHTVIGVDPQSLKVEMLLKGISPVIEADVTGLLTAGIEGERIFATTDAREAVLDSDMGFICVGTPSQNSGALDLTYLKRVGEELGAAIARHDGYFVVVLRSTVLPRTTRDVLLPILEKASGLRAGADFGLCFNPEFLREGMAVNDFRFPPKTVIGALDERSREALTPIVARNSAPTIQTDLETAELVKYADNTWHALKVAFANEIGSLAKGHGIDGREVMEIFCSDEKLNISSAYLKPGFAFGGSCLPKDVRAIVHKGRRMDLDLPLINSILPSNQEHLDRAFELITKVEQKRIGMLGLSFKAGTDDLRESPMVDMVERLIGKGYDVRIYDQNVNLAKLFGANRDFILNQIPHISKLMVETGEELLHHAETIVVGTADPEFIKILANADPNQRVVDLVRINDELLDTEGYDGICW